MPVKHFVYPYLETKKEIKNNLSTKRMYHLFIRDDNYVIFKIVGIGFGIDSDTDKGKKNIIAQIKILLEVINESCDYLR